MQLLALPRPSDRCRWSYRARSLLKGGRLRPSPRRWAQPQGAPLTVILGRKRMPGTEDGPGPAFAGRDYRRSVTAGTADLRKRGSPTLAAAACPAGLPPEGARHVRRPLSRAVAPPAPPLGPGGDAHLSHASALDDFASPACVRAIGPARGVPKARP
jgi:hypothetical protein